MTRWYRWLAVVLVALWLPTTMHCLLEVYSGLEALACSTPSNHAPHQDSDCSHDVCATLETGGFLAPCTETPLPDPLGSALSAVSLEVPPPPELVRQPIIRLEAPPPELAASWRFLWRVAQPARAPSFVS